MRFLVIAPTFSFLFGCSLPALTAQAPGACLTDPEGSSREVSFAKRLYQGVDSTTVAAQGFPYASAANITLVTEDSTCVAALDAYNAPFPPESPNRAHQAYVVRLSGNGYMVVVPSDKAGEFLRRHIFDANWVRKIAVAG